MTVSSTRARSNAVPLIAFRTSLVAVWRSRDSVVWLKSRTFSIAIAACAANVSSRPIWRSLYARASERRSTIAPSAAPSRSSGAATMAW